MVELKLISEQGLWSDNEEEWISVLSFKSIPVLEKEGTFDFNANYNRTDRTVIYYAYISSHWSEPGLYSEYSSDYLHGAQLNL